MPLIFYQSDGRACEKVQAIHEPIYCNEVPRIVVSSVEHSNLKFINASTGPVNSIQIMDCRSLSFISINVKVGSLLLKDLPSLRTIEASSSAVISSIEIESCHLNLTLPTVKLSKITFRERCSINVISLEGNLLSSIDLANVKNVKTLRLNRNDISSLDLRGMIHLVHLDVYECKLERIDVSDLISLETLDVSHNQLRYLEIVDLTKLHYVCASDNEINEVIMDNNPSLDKLDLSNNKLVNFVYWCPEKPFRELDLRGNDLDYVALSFKNVKNLRVGRTKLLYAPFLLSSDSFVLNIVPGDAVTSNVFPLLERGWKGDPRFGTPKIPTELGVSPKVRWIMF
jgi:Leucine-rich repeat (LRR) protein